MLHSQIVLSDGLFRRGTMLLSPDEAAASCRPTHAKVERRLGELDMKDQDLREQKRRFDKEHGHHHRHHNHHPLNLMRQTGAHKYTDEDDNKIFHDELHLVDAVHHHR